MCSTGDAVEGLYGCTGQFPSALLLLFPLLFFGFCKIFFSGGAGKGVLVIWSKERKEAKANTEMRPRRWVEEITETEDSKEKHDQSSSVEAIPETYRAT